MDSSFTTGAAVAAVWIGAGGDPVVATLLAMVAGLAAGLVTGAMHAAWRIQDLLAAHADRLTVEENLALAWRRGQRLDLGLGVTRVLRERFRAALRVVQMGLEDRLGLPTQGLSGGQRQALALVMASISEPQLLLLDEHTAALDPSCMVFSASTAGWNPPAPAGGAQGRGRRSTTRTALPSWRGSMPGGSR